MVGAVFHHNSSLFKYEDGKNKERVKILLKRINFNGNSIGFRPQTQRLRAHTKLIVSCESTAEEVSFEW